MTVAAVTVLIFSRDASWAYSVVFHIIGCAGNVPGTNFVSSIFPHKFVLT